VRGSRKLFTLISCGLAVPILLSLLVSTTSGTFFWYAAFFVVCFSGFVAYFAAYVMRPLTLANMKKDLKRGSNFELIETWNEAIVRRLLMIDRQGQPHD
jgi:hypothetical protein